MNRVAWCGDVDGNGTADVFIDDPQGRGLVLGYVRQR
jgi:hypothetical protein